MVYREKVEAGDENLLPGGENVAPGGENTLFADKKPSLRATTRIGWLANQNISLNISFTAALP